MLISPKDVVASWKPSRAKAALWRALLDAIWPRSRCRHRPPLPPGWPPGRIPYWQCSVFYRQN